VTALQTDCVLVLGRRVRVSGRVKGMPRLIRVECQDPLAVSCATCGGATQIWGYDPVELLPWTVIKHLLTEHWDGAHDPTLIDGQEGP
jgi:hypothetical protein